VGSSGAPGSRKKKGVFVKGLSRSLFALVGAAVLAVGLAACGDSDSGSSTEPVKLRLGYVTTPQHPYGLAIDAFKKEVEAASAGKVTVENIPNYTGGDSQLFDDVVGGTIEMAGISTAIWDVKGSNVFQALQAPFLITNYGHSQEVLGGEIGRAMLDSANGPSKFGLVGLGLLEGGLRKPLGGDVALKNPADFKGKKIRAPQSKVLSATITALGAEPVALPVGDVFTALQNGTVDGMEANLGLIYTNKYYEVAKFVTQDVNLWPFPAAVVINKSQWDKLTDEQQGWLRTAGENLFPETTIAAFVSPPPGAINFTKELCDLGLTFAFAGDANRAALAKASEAAVEELSADPEVAGFIKQIQDAKAAAPVPPAPPPLPAGCKTA
jgi:tripartite ATP-independent transporter DctP family solute receptor